ncbi:hypothetical protein [Labedella endophytica]|uniref:Uncharacterized protein n=1 Tax=Labedella endophytica TaxID=1523160 RepID=A0A433JTR3_9MICO|nr:hypothetical protein [Labedella endophytica]RUR01417.1 hypothetical protein ELQ94_07930 [Labedella endophytica]
MTRPMTTSEAQAAFIARKLGRDEAVRRRGEEASRERRAPTTTERQIAALNGESLEGEGETREREARELRIENRRLKRRLRIEGLDLDA